MCVCVCVSVWVCTGKALTSGILPLLMRHSSFSPYPYHHSHTLQHTYVNIPIHKCARIHIWIQSHRHRHKQLPPEVAAAGAAPAPPNQCANNKAVNFCMRLNKLYIFVFSVEKVFQSWVVLGTATIREKRRSKNFLQYFSLVCEWVYLTGQSHTSKSLKQKNNCDRKKENRFTFCFDWNPCRKITKPSCSNGDLK